MSSTPNSNPIPIADPDSELPTLLKTPIQTPIPAEIYTPYLTKFPFITLSPSPTTSTSTSTTPPLPLNLRTLTSPSLPPHKIYRSGTLSLPHLTPSHLSTLHTAHKITTIFDLRSLAERNHAPSPTIPGISTIWIPSSADKGQPIVAHVPVSEFESNEGEDGYISQYGKMLTSYREAFRGVFEKISKSDGDDAILFHCSAGKDRTGLLSALILTFMSTPAEYISHDYALTRIGVEPFREALLRTLLQQMGKEAGEVDINAPGMEAICGVRGPTIIAVLKSMDEKWGKGREEKGEMWPGVQGYLRSEDGLGLDENLLESVRKNLAA